MGSKPVQGDYPSSFKNFKKRWHPLRVNEAKPDTENAPN